MPDLQRGSSQKRPISAIPSGAALRAAKWPGGRPFTEPGIRVSRLRSANEFRDRPTLALVLVRCRVEEWRGCLGLAYLLPALSSAGASLASPCPVSTPRSSNRTGPNQHHRWNRWYEEGPLKEPLGRIEVQLTLVFIPLELLVLRDTPPDRGLIPPDSARASSTIPVVPSQQRPVHVPGVLVTQNARRERQSL